MKITNYLALKANMGDWEYYVTTMKASDLVEYVKFAEEVVPNPELDEILQRNLAKRSEGIAEFLTSNKERFFGSLILAVYGGSPKFSRVEIDSIGLLGISNSMVGILQFDGKEDYYVLDGQHRLAAIKSVLKKGSQSLENDQISVVLISHTRELDGIQRARRLFTNLNRYTVKTSKADNIVIDEDDGYAILTRRLVREHDFFKEVIKISKADSAGKKTLVTGEALQKKDHDYLATLPTLYECNKNLLAGVTSLSAQAPQSRPDEETLSSCYQVLCDRWDELLGGIHAFSVDTEKRKFIRDSAEGGKVVHRPIGLKSITSAAGSIFSGQGSANTLIDNANRFSELSEYPWKGLLWNPTSHKMEAGKSRIEVASKVYLALTGALGADELVSVNEELLSFGAKELKQ